ncbi:BTB/POZ domain-containing protein NPY2 isoform X4 [Ricinus communis]|uniref:BTB/POZ domain-containing protein NPY2 isoform X4 n=1 Tax=Ricinus communis TaxID=3988 RepID=UPI00201ABFE9|nr:BTB/POZ domain-containing protein NPY2 isoform X4 [Ricinus communis]
MLFSVAGFQTSTFMKLGSKPDSFQTDVNNVRSVANDLATDFIINVGDVKFYLHKFPLLAKSARLQKSATTANGDNCDEVDISDIPGGPAAFEICAKFCYGMIVTLNAFNVVAARCASEYLGMHETIEKGNLIYKIDVFLSASIFRSWKDSIIVLQTTSYNRKKLPEENGNDPNVNSIRNRSVPKDWWVEDLCDLDIDLYKRVILAIKSKAILSSDVIGEALKAYAYRRLQGLSKGMVQCGEAVKYKSTVDTIVWLLPADRGSLSCSFLLKLLKAAIYVDLGDMAKGQLIRRIGQQLEEASIHDLLIRTAEGESMMYDVDTVKKIVEEFLMQDQNAEVTSLEEGDEIQEIRRPGILSDASKLMVAKLIDGYLAEIAKDPNLPFLKFVELAELVTGISRPAHDALYRAIDMFLKEHQGISKGERKRICKLMDCKKLSVDACMHAVQNERLPLRVVVQVLFFEQVRVAATSGSSTPDLPRSLRDLNNGSSRSAVTNLEEDWDAVATVEELKALRAEIASLRTSNGERNGGYGKHSIDKVTSYKMKGLLKSKKIFAKLWSSKGGGEKGENSGSDSSDSLGSANPEEAKSTPSRNRRHSVS